MKTIRFFLSAIVLLFPVVIWNVIALDYINVHGKLIAYILAPFFAVAAAGVFLGFESAKKPLWYKGYPNYFYAWLTLCLIVSFGIVALSNS